MGQALETELVDFDALGASPERSKANQLLPEIGRLFVMTSDTCSEEQLEVYDDVLLRLADMVEITARICLAEMMAPLDRAPRALIRKLAQDDIAVAAPVLLESRILDDIDLAYIAHTQSDDHLDAIARRESVSDSVSDVLITKGSDRVLSSVASNSGADISDEGFEKLIDRSQVYEALQDCLAQRQDLPRAILERFMSMATERVRQSLLSTGKVEQADRVEKAAEIAKERLMGKVGLTQNDIAKAIVGVRAMHDAGTLSPYTVMSFADRDQRAEVICAISILTKARLDLTYNVMTQANPGAFIVFAKAGKLGEDLVMRLLETGHWRECLSSDLRGKALKTYRNLTLEKAVALRNRMMRPGQKKPN